MAKPEMSITTVLKILEEATEMSDTGKSQGAQLATYILCCLRDATVKVMNESILHMVPPEKKQ